MNESESCVVMAPYNQCAVSNMWFRFQSRIESYVSLVFRWKYLFLTMSLLPSSFLCHTFETLHLEDICHQPCEDAAAIYVESARVAFVFIYIFMDADIEAFVLLFIVLARWHGVKMCMDQYTDIWPMVRWCWRLETWFVPSTRLCMSRRKC